MTQPPVTRMVRIIIIHVYKNVQGTKYSDNISPSVNTKTKSNIAISEQLKTKQSNAG